MNSSPLINAIELAAALDRPAPPAILDVRWQLGGPPGIDAYRAGHIPGAAFCDLETDLSARPGLGGRHPLPATEAFEVAMRRLGVSPSRPVVVHDDGAAVPAARAWWCLRYFGHDDVRVLDGGFRAWVGAGLPISTEEQGITPGDFVATPGGMPLLNASSAADLARDGVLLDVRAAQRYRGEAEPIDLVAGHIPGAVSDPATGTIGVAGVFRTPRELADRFAAIGAQPGTAVGAYCGSGVTAAHTVLALEVAGVKAALYAGSWSEWITDPSRPVATGDGHAVEPA